MVSLSSVKIINAFISITVAVMLFALFWPSGLSPIFIATLFLSLAAAICLLYLSSDRMMITLMRASRRDVPAPVRSEISQYCDREHMHMPLIAVIERRLPDVYVDGIGKRKTVVMITSGAIDQLDESELRDMAIRELESLKTYKMFDMAAVRLVIMPLDKMYERSVYHRHMHNGMNLAGQANEHVIVRIAEDKDFLRMYRMGVDAFRESTGFIPLHKLAYRYKKPTAIRLIAEYDGQPAGYIIGHIKQGSGGIYGHIDIIAVDAQYREKGIGMGLTEIFMRALEEYGCRHCCLEVWEHNDAAIKLYEKAGFAKRAILEDYYKKGQHAQVMCKILKA